VFENKFSGSKNIIAQIYATALGNSAYTTTYFYQNFCDACFRYKHSVSDIYESICRKKNDVDKRYMQNPVFIKGENEFCISNTLNKDVERQIYQDIIDIYNDYVNCKINECDKYKKISEILYEENYELAKIGGPKKYVINIMENYCLRECKYQFISCLLRLPIYTAVIREKSFRLHSKCGWYEFKNTNLYDFEQCEEALENDCREVYNGIKLLLDHIFYINVHEASATRQFELRIENVEKKDLRNFFDSENLFKNVYDALKDRKSILISASNRTDEIGFLKSLVFECISPEEKILFLRYMEDISSYNNVENVFINEIWTDGNMSDLYLNKIANKRYRWLIISLHSSLDVFTNETEINKVKELVDIAKENKIPVIFLTNTIPYAINITNITKRFYEYADVEIDLESSDCKEKTYVSNIVALGADTIKIL